MLAYRDDAMYTPPPLPRWRLILNSILGLAFWILTFFLRQKTSSFLPLTLDTLGQILLTDITRQKSARALAQLQRKTAHADAEHSAAAGRGNAAGVPYLVSIVGYREEEALFRRCLQSYRTTCTGAATLLVGIDGDEPEDLEMVATVRSVYPQAVVLGLPEPLGEMAQRLAELKAFGGHFVPSESAHERLEVFHALPEEVKRDAEEWAMEEVIVNDDRHLSTCLMLANYRITFNTYVLTLTDTPTTSMALLLQQLRWSRATYIETLQYPLLYAIRGPVALICAVRRVYGPLAMAVFTARYAWSGSVPFAFSPLDFALRLALCAGYNLLFFRRHLRGAVRHWSLLVASQLFYQVPLPGIAVWSCVTMLQGSWGTSMRGVGEKRRARHPGERDVR
ncbi:putative glycosyltransferase family 2 protein [Neofusicoccum parvum UCRNP2]|uniref:Putative glycosyltransferase family 2 protein n=1 Tax=Botryosphaeria parva (strain UCR-NP2) TaxID=1287680 RepID=R1EY36_BOTPV|nr:putative glycosyltransferase family 2 protein [Neofusicoccum parvum UCRNP2]